ncbi:unnamed protein product, partial [Prorocentrum cordatum]
ATAPMQCDGSLWDDIRNNERDVKTKKAPQWIQDSIAYQQDPNMTDVLGQLYGRWAHAAERMLATITEAPMRPRARGGQPTQYVEVPYTRYVKGNKDGDTKADQR